MSWGESDNFLIEEQVVDMTFSIYLYEILNVNNIW